MSIVTSPRTILLELGRQATTPERNAARLFADAVRQRTGADASTDPGKKHSHTLVLGTRESSELIRRRLDKNPAGFGTDGFCLETRPDGEGRIYIVGQSPSGVVAGVGELLRMCRYEDGVVTIPDASLTKTPRMPIRGMYFATHLFNFYHVAPLEEVDRLIEDLALWGCNSFAVWFDMHHFQSLDDPEAQDHLACLTHFGETARSLGMEFGVPFASNEAYASSPEELRIEPIPAALGCEICPSKPGGLEKIAECQAGVLDAFPHLDFVVSWPQDSGGCGCEKCAPWGANGHLIASEQLARLFHERFPEGKLWLSTWLFDISRFWPDSHAYRDEFDGLFDYMRDKKPEWLTGILHGGHNPDDYDRVLKRPMADRYPLTCFPEISMRSMIPWGGCGANPQPDLSAEYFGKLAGSTVGGWPYSEGIYEDVNKFLWVRHFWDPDRSVDEILAEYAEAYLDPDCADDFVRLAHLLEKDHGRNGFRIGNLAGADEAWQLAQSIDARLRPWARESWRWRVLYLRAQIDDVVRRQGYVSPEARRALAPLSDEISSIYRVDETTSDLIRPAAARDPDAPAPDEAGNLAYNRPVQASSIYPEASSTDFQCKLVDGDSANAVQVGPFDKIIINSWSNDPERDPTPWVTIDLGKWTKISEVGILFHHVDKKYGFAPSTIAFSVSDDAETFEPILESTDVPQEDDEGSPDFRSYAVRGAGRYLRLDLGRSQRTADPDAGRIVLWQIRVGGLAVTETSS